VAPEILVCRLQLTCRLGLSLRLFLSCDRQQLRLSLLALDLLSLLQDYEVEVNAPGFRLRVRVAELADFEIYFGLAVALP
jgi:VanZ family protein